MPKASPGQLAFYAGEITPLLYGRTDIPQYRAGLKKCLRFIPVIQGAVTRCPGSYFSAEVKDSSKATRLQRFEFSVTQAYMLEFGNLYVRPYRNNGPVRETALVITNVTQANPAVVTYTGTDPANGEEMYVSAVGGMTTLNNRQFKIANVNGGANTFELQYMTGTPVNSTGFVAYTTGGTAERAYTVTTPYLAADVFNLNFVQSADVLYIAHPSYKPRKLSRTAHTAWTLTNIDFLDGPYLNINTLPTTFLLSGTTGSVNVTASAIAGINDGAGFLTTDVGRLIRWRDPANNWTWLEITAWTSTTLVTATIRGANASAVTATTFWRMGEWSDTTGYPGAVTFYEDRLVWGGATKFPQRIDGSNSGDYENMAPTAANGVVTNGNAIAFTLNSSTVNVIRWLSDDEQGLLIGTTGGTWVMRPSSQVEALSPTNVSAKQFSTFGSSTHQAIRAGESTIYVQRERRVMREIFNAAGKYSATNLSASAEHITIGGMGQMAFQLFPQGIIWTVRTDGVLLGATYSMTEGRLNQIIGWHRHILGGTFGSGAAVVESVACIPTVAGDSDEVWLIVKRTIEGVTKRYVEFLTQTFDEGDNIVDAFFVDCGLTYAGAAASTISGLWHLEGQEVSILAAGAAHPARTVVNGSITLTGNFTPVHVGKGYNSDIETLRFDAGAADGTSLGKLQRIIRAGIRLVNTVGMKYGRNTASLDTLPFRSDNDPTGGPIALFTGDKVLEWPSDYGLDETIYIRQDLPLPMTISSILPQLTTEDRG